MESLKNENGGIARGRTIDELSDEYNTLYKNNRRNIQMIKTHLHDIQTITNNQNNHMNIYRDILKKLANHCSA